MNSQGTVSLNPRSLNPCHHMGSFCMLLDVFNPGRITFRTLNRLRVHLVLSLHVIEMDAQRV